MSMINSKRAQGGNYILIVAFLLVFGFMNIVMYAIFVEFTDALTAGGFYIGQAQITGENFKTGLATFDWGMVLLMVGMIIVMGILFSKLATAPIFFIITVIMGIFWGFISYFFNYIFSEMVSTAALATAQTFFPRTLVICTNLHWVALAAIVVGSLTLYAKREKGQFLT